MADIAVCPDRTVLQQLLIGQLDEGSTATVEQHLFACEPCCGVLHELEASDTLAEVVRALTAEEPPLDTSMLAVMQRLKEVTLPGKAMEETLARGVEPTGDAWDLEKFLDPPEAEGELGRFGGYRVLRVLGAGGMGLVLEGEDPKLRRRVALKVMKSSLAARDEHHQRFLREARAAAAIEHPHIVTVHQVGEHRGLPFMAMQLLKGEALDERLRRRPALPLAECLRIGRETAEALAEAHGRNLIHRDIKPGNIWLEGTSGWVKLVDFGLAHAAEDVHLTQTGAIMGTPAYMSPEQARGETVDGRSDLYSLGAVLYKVTTGDVPFRGASTMAVLMALATQTPRPPSEINPDVPPALDDLILRLLAKQPDERFESAEAVAEALRAIEADRASPKSGVQSPTLDEGAGRRHLRWRRLVAGAAAVAALLAAVAIVIKNREGRVVATIQAQGDVDFTLDPGYTATVKTSSTRKQAAAGEILSPDGRRPPDVPELAIAPFDAAQARAHQKQWAGYLKLPPVFTNSVGMKFVLIPPGEFTMGSTSAEIEETIEKLITTNAQHRHDAQSEAPQHTVVVTRPFYLATHEVTQKEYEVVLGRTPSSFAKTGSVAQMVDAVAGTDTGNHPVEQVTWNDAAEFCSKLSLDEELQPFYYRKGEATTLLQGNGYRLPSEAEWEFACRAGTTTRFWNGDDSPPGWFLHNANLRTHQVEQFAANPFGLYDVHGNVWEWVQDAWELKYYENLGPRAQDPVCPFSAGPMRVMRGGDYGNDASLCRSSTRRAVYPTDHGHYLGFRVALPVEGVSLSRQKPRNGAIAVSPPAKIPEPPPLDEWLKGREVLTVAQDGSGQFKTIQAALEALQPGQVVSVLDRGPYRERLVLEPVPPDTGLMSSAGTVIELSEWKSVPHGDFADFHEGHVFAGIDGFRLHGFELAFPQGTSTGCKLRFSQTIGLVLEACLVRAVPMASEFGEPLAVDNISNEAPGFSAHVRDCLIDGYLELHAHKSADVTLVVERNYFTSGRVDHHLHFHGDAWKQVVVRHNVFTGQSAHDLLIKNAWKPSSLLEVTNNTTTTVVTQVIFTESARHGRVTVRNNLCTSPCLLSVFKGAENDLAAAQATWRVDHNVYPEPSRGQADLINWIKKQGVPRNPADVASMPRFLSKDVANRDYLRIAADGPLATAGAGGDWPSYVGALPPGPPPTDGDWFSRLHVRTQKAANAKSIDIPAAVEITEPPPLDEWLKGRTILTVAQDGSGQFKTIQTALDALRPGQVVEVLDRGPYCERLNCGRIATTGLVSRNGTVVRAPGAHPHDIAGTNDFRLSGFEFLPFEGGYKESWIALLNLHYPGALVVERCHFRAMPVEPAELYALGLHFIRDRGEQGAEPIFIRDCILEGRVNLQSTAASFEPRVVFERNWICPADFSGSALAIVGLTGTYVVRHNVIERTPDAAIRFSAQPAGADPHGLDEAAQHPNGIRLLLYNNSLPRSGMTVSEWVEQISAKVEAYNNLFGEPVFFNKPAYDRLPIADKDWDFGHNYYLRAPQELDEFRLRPTDGDGDAKLASRDSASGDFLRPLADSPLASGGAGGALPNYIGALPPGPAPKDGDWFSRLRERRQGADKSKAAAKATNIPPPVAVAEPPPLEEWLKGRTVLTVAQDGSAQFKTIQAALDALQAGQVVKVLDRGPYRERLDVEEVPADSGLVADKGTVLELADYAFHYRDANHEFNKGHFFRDMDGFRMAGFTLVFPKPPNVTSYGLQTRRCGGFVLERCWVQSPVEAIVSYHQGGSNKLSCVRECRIDGVLHVGSEDNEQAATVIARNLFLGDLGFAHVGEDSVYKYLGIRNNVFVRDLPGIEVHRAKHFERLDIANNTFLGRDPASFYTSLPKGEVVVCNNLRLRPGLLAMLNGAENNRDEILSHWRIGHNSYPRELTPDENWMPEQIIPRTAADLLGTPTFISKLATDRDYLRPEALDPIARAGLGGGWPDYVGALPPGPAPDDGDWFTRLRQCWPKTKGAGSVEEEAH